MSIQRVSALSFKDGMRWDMRIYRLIEKPVLMTN